jgi:hypothetical protein
VNGPRIGWRVAVGIAAVVLSASGCGGDESSPADQQPKLASLLTDVDDDITAGHFVQARQSLNALVTSTESARGSGALDISSAERVLAAAAELKTQLSASIRGGQTNDTPTEPTTSGDGGDDGNSGPGDGGHGPGNPDKPHKPHHGKPDKRG